VTLVEVEIKHGERVGKPVKEVRKMAEGKEGR
jgi:hypothetical protein